MPRQRTERKRADKNRLSVLKTIRQTLKQGPWSCKMKRSSRNAAIVGFVTRHFLFINGRADRLIIECRDERRNAFAPLVVDYRMHMHWT